LPCLLSSFASSFILHPSSFQVLLMAEARDNWHEVIHQTRAYLEVLHEGGFGYADGTFEVVGPKEAPKVGSKKRDQQPKRTARPASPETTEHLRAAVTDPYAHLTAPGQRAAAAPAATSSRSAPPPPAQAPPPRAKGITLGDRAEGVKTIAEANDLQRIAHLISGCYMCGLAAGRTIAVPGEGNPQADLMFIGEGPGYYEDVQGRPFVGRAGQLLTQMIQAMGLQREEVFIANIVKCRPPGNRDPLPDEIKACEPFLKRQIELIRPKLICALGRISIQGLLRDTTPITQLRGKWRTYSGIPLMPTFHPAYLLRNPAEKRSAWQDLQAIMARMVEMKKGG
jgi:DNA polymerase